MYGEEGLVPGEEEGEIIDNNEEVVGNGEVVRDEGIVDNENVRVVRDEGIVDNENVRVV